MTNILYNDLKTLIGASSLVPEEQYRITDYVTTVAKANYTSAGYKFDIVVTALTNDTLYEYALLLSNASETYFDAEGLLIYNIRYNVNNVIPGYANDWVDANGKGCIYYMVDNKGNEAPYDFKNIKHNGKFLFNNVLDGTDTSQTVSEYNVVKEVIEDGVFTIPLVRFDYECRNVTIGINASEVTITESSNLQIGDNCENSDFTNVNNTTIGNEVSDATLTSIDGAEIGDNCVALEVTNQTNLILGNNNNTITLGGGNGVIIDSNNTNVTIGTNAKDVYINGSKTLDLGNNIEQFNISSSYNMTIADDCKLFNLNETNHLTATTGCENINTIKNDYLTLTEEVKNVTITERLTNLILDGTKLTGSDGKLIIQQDDKVVIVNEQTNSEVVLVEDGTTTSNPTSYINDSPADGFVYGRKDGDWEQIDTSGDYEVTYDDVVDALTYVPISTDKIGVANGLAMLDAQGYVLNAQLPSYVDDIIEVDTFTLLPVTGEKGKIYIVTDSGKTYRWATTQYVTISESLTLGTGSEQAYPGNLGAALRTDVDGKANTLHTHTKSEVGLDNVDNTSDLTKPISTATQTALNGKADKGTTLGDYEIADAYTQTEIDTKLVNIKHNDILNRNGDTNFLHITETEKTNFITASDFVEDFISNATDILHTDLLALINNDGLIPSSSYRIIDYTTTTIQADTQSAGHDFDIIVTALSTNKLSEIASCVRKSDDTYFTNAKLEAWKIKYCIYNDTSRFAWADVENGKGVIYRMIDDFNNDVPYDFKNIQFKNENDIYVFTFGGTTDDSLTGKSVGNTIKESIVSSKLSLNFNTFGTNCNFNILGFNNNNNTFGDYCNSNAFDAECRFNKFGDDCYFNTFGNSCRFNTLSNESGSNTFGLNCWYNTFGDGCYSNNFGDGCISNNLSDYCSHNTFGNECTSNNLSGESTSNIFGDYCGNNTFGAECRHNKFGNNYYNNEFGNECSVNRFGTDCNSNIFGESCQYNTFGNDCDNNTFNNYYSSNTFGDYCSNNNFYHGISGTVKKDFVKYVVLEEGCSKNNFYYPLTTSGGAYLRRIRIKGLDNATQTNIIILLPDTSSNYEWIISRAIDGTINQYCPKDHTLDISNLQTNKANKASTLSGYGIEDAYTKVEINNKISAVFRYKGNVATYAALTALTGMVTGDVYNVTNTGINYAWTGSAWESLAGTIDLSAYLEKTEASTIYETIANVEALASTVNTNVGKISNLQTNKQNKLIAGNNIVFSDNVISVDLDDYLKTTDAPSNDKTYGRKNGSWSEIDTSGGGGGGMVNITWSALRTLRNDGTLVPGQAYRITNYVCKTTTENSRALNNLFDIIVTALDESHLSENASATYHDGDSYFSSNNANLESWELKYCIDNDDDRFDWVNTANGRGVIYYMKDERGNECPYDFKNIQYLKNGVWLYTFGGATDNSVVVYSTFRYCYNNIIGVYCTVVNQILKYTLSFNTFGNDCYSNTVGDNCDLNTFGNGCFSNTFGNKSRGNTFGVNCYNNTFGNICAHNTFGNNCQYNTFGNRSSYNTFGTDFNSNTFGYICDNNTFGDSCYSNTFGDNCQLNTFGNGCYNNNFGNDCQSNTFGSGCINNTFGNSFFSNTFGINFLSNTFGDNCGGNTFGNHYQYNTFGYNCKYNNFYAGTSGTTLKYFIRFIVLEDSVSYNNFYSDLTTSGGTWLQRIRIKGLNGTVETPLVTQISLSATNTNYEWVICRRSNGTLKQYCPDD